MGARRQDTICRNLRPSSLLDIAGRKRSRMALTLSNDSSSNDTGADVDAVRVVDTSSNSIFDTLKVSLRRLDLTSEQTDTVMKRVKTMSAKQKSKILNIDSTFSWLEDPIHLGLTKEHMRDIVVGYPPLVGMSLETNIAPTITFLYNALDGNCNEEKGDDGDNTMTDLPGLHDEQPTLARSETKEKLRSLLAKMPSLLEYSVQKRLAPRLRRLLEMLNITSVNEEMLEIIATKTDSRFEEWLVGRASGLGSADDDNQRQEGENASSNSYDAESISRRSGKPSLYIILSNLQSGGNIGNIVRSASIFGCDECLVVGQKRYRLTGDHGSRFDFPRRHVYTHEDAKDYLLRVSNDVNNENQSMGVSPSLSPPSSTESQVRIYGVEIMANASPLMRYDSETGVVQFPFNRKWSGAAFIFGNEGQGLSDKQKEICDEFLFIPQTRGGSKMGGGGGSASLNVACAATVVLQAYCLWAGYSDAVLEGEKFMSQSPTR